MGRCECPSRTLMYVGFKLHQVWSILTVFVLFVFVAVFIGCLICGGAALPLVIISKWRGGWRPSVGRGARATGKLLKQVGAAPYVTPPCLVSCLSFPNVAQLQSQVLEQVLACRALTTLIMLTFLVRMFLKRNKGVATFCIIALPFKNTIRYICWDDVARHTTYSCTRTQLNSRVIVQTLDQSNDVDFRIFIRVPASRWSHIRILFENQIFELHWKVE